MGNADSKDGTASSPASVSKAVSPIKLDEITIRTHTSAEDELPDNSAHGLSPASTENSFRRDIQSDSPDGRCRRTSVIQEEKIPVNLNMVDLMKYLQLVASRSANLPRTRRDDPELGKVVSNLTADEYCELGGAFIPGDFKIISGAFTKYGKVWDLPTSESYTPVDGAQEPGLTQGGACTNSLLKVLYDMENSVDDVMRNSLHNHSDLFRDDSHDDSMSIPPMQSSSSASLDMDIMNSPCKLSWVELLKKMKVEMEQIGHPQLPVLSSSRKFDMSEGFSLIPKTFDPVKNKKRSLLIGCQYKEIELAGLKGSHDDVRSMQDFIVNIYGFPKDKDVMTVLMDCPGHKRPTYNNIIEAFKSLSEKSMPGDAVFVHFSGHGCRVLDTPIDESVDSYDEALIPSDFETAGIIRDTLMFKTLIAPMRKGVRVTCILDACDTGVMVDLPYRWCPGEDMKDGINKMTLNDDFSFIRFLKVIKALYDHSTFTQLGRTVGTVLSNKSPKALAQFDDESLDDDLLSDAGSLVTADRAYRAKRGSFLADVLAACHSPNPGIGLVVSQNLTDMSDFESTVGSKRSALAKNVGLELELSSIFHHMLQCNAEILSDDETTDGRPSKDDDSFGDDSDDGATSCGEETLSQASPYRQARAGVV